MTEDNDLANLPEATVVARRRQRISPVWIIPILAVVVSLGIAISAIINEGPTITIVLKAAEGIEAGKTFVKYKDVNIGQVTSVQLTDDFSKVQVKAKIAKSAAGLIVEDATFWVVRPRVSLSGISGLGTLLGGNYIGFAAGKSSERHDLFNGLEVPPVISGVAGRQYLLKANDLGSLGTGSPIYFRRLQVGQVIAYDLSSDGKTMDIKVLIDAPYDRYVNPNTRFWNASGIDLTVNANGVEMRTESLVALLAGGLAFDNPPTLEQDEKIEQAPANASFALYADRTAAMKQPEMGARHYALTFNESLRGLSVGAPVTFFGLPVGVVTEIGLSYDPATLGSMPRVSIDFFPERIAKHFTPKAERAARALINGSAAKRHTIMQRLVQERGLRAQLRSGSLLTGQLYIALDYFPGAPPAKIDWKLETPGLPVVPSLLPDLESKFASIMTKLDKLPLEAIGKNLNEDLDALHQTLAQAGTLMQHADAKVLPELEKTLAAAERLIGNADKTLIGPDAPVQQELRDALQELARAARSLRALTDYLERYPESLIRGKDQQSTGER
jgi:paraquat-inducible protein B